MKKFKKGDRVLMLGTVTEIERNPDKSQRGCWVRWDGDMETFLEVRSLHPHTVRTPPEGRKKVDAKEQERDRQDAARYRMLLEELDGGGCLTIGSDATVELNDSFGEGITEFDISAKLDSLIEGDKERSRKPAKKVAKKKGARKQ